MFILLLAMHFVFSLFLAFVDGSSVVYNLRKVSLRHWIVFLQLPATMSYLYSSWQRMQRIFIVDAN